MPVVEPPRSLLARAAGWMVLVPGEYELQVFIREDPVNMGLYPRPCSIDMRLPFWSMPPVVAAALLVSVVRCERLTFRAWIDVRRARGIQVLNSLSKDNRITVNVVTDRVERTIRAPNVVRRPAKELIKKLSSTTRAWSDDELESAEQQLETLYPTTWKLWRALKADGRG